MRRTWFALTLAASATLCAQEKPAGTNGSLQEAMQVLEQNLPQRISYSVSKRIRDGRGYTPPATVAYELNNVKSEAGCLLRFHLNFGNLDRDFEIPLQFVNDHDINVRPMDRIEANNHPGLITTISPPIFTVKVSAPDVTTTFLFTDEATARRVSQALHRAAALCPDYTTDGWR